MDGSKNEEFRDERILRAVFNQKENEEGNLIDIDKDSGLKQMKYTIDSVDTVYDRHKLINVRF